MYRTKSDVDKQVEIIHKTIRSVYEKKLRGFYIARLYYHVKDFDNAFRYIHEYLSVKQNVAEAYCLLGDICAEMQKNDEAVKAYTLAYECEIGIEYNKKVILKVCEILTKPSVDINNAQFWLDLLETYFPTHPNLCQLREKLKIENSCVQVDHHQLEDSIIKQLILNPEDVLLRMKLLMFYKENDRIVEAFNHAFEIELKTLYLDNWEWYSSLLDIHEEYIKFEKASKDWIVHLSYLHNLDHLIELSFDNKAKYYYNEVKTTYTSSQVLLKLHKELLAANELENTPPYWNDIIHFYVCQLSYYMAVMFFQEIQNRIFIWNEVSHMIYFLLYFSCYHLSELWCTDNLTTNNIIERLFLNEAPVREAVRLSQCGHILLKSDCEQPEILSKSFNNKDNIRLIFCKLFGKNNKMAFKNNVIDKFKIINYYDFLTNEELIYYDKIASQACIKNLHKILWICLHYINIDVFNKLYGGESQGSYPLYLFGTFCSLEMDIISELDIKAFLFASLFNAAKIINHRNACISINEFQSSILPPSSAICLLCNEKQEKWWNSICDLHLIQPFNYTAYDHSFIHLGLETICCKGKYDLPFEILLNLARSFTQKVSGQLSNDDELINVNLNYKINEYDLRAQIYWNAILKSLETLQSTGSLTTHSNCIFEDFSKSPSKAIMNEINDEAIMFLSCLEIKKKNFENSLNLLKQIHKPLSFYYQSAIYNYLSTSALNTEQKLSLLLSAKENLLITVDHLKHNNFEKNFLSSIISYLLCEIEKKVKMLEENIDQQILYDAVKENEITYVDRSTPLRSREENYSLFEKDDFNYDKFNTEMSQKGIIKSIIEINKIHLEENHCLISLQKENTKLLNEMKDAYEEIYKEIMKMKNDLALLNNQKETGNAYISYSDLSNSTQNLQIQNHNSQQNSFSGPEGGIINCSNSNVINFSPEIKSSLPNATHIDGIKSCSIDKNSFKKDLPKCIPMNESVSKEYHFLPMQALSVQNNSSDDGMSIFGSKCSENISFSTLASEGKIAPAFEKKDNFKGWNIEKNKLFSSQHINQEDQVLDEFVPNIEYKPTIPLPELVKTVTGEEDETEMFAQRAKLFRYDDDSKQWKERGIGDLKIMKNKINGKTRLVMRREQVLKVCANHFITLEMNLQPLSNSENAWLWYANDFSEGELCVQKFAVRFKKNEQAREFKNIIDKIQSEYKSNQPNSGHFNDDKFNKNNDNQGKNTTASMSSWKEADIINKTSVAFDDKFKPSSGSWFCSSCYLINESSSVRCIACEATNPSINIESHTAELSPLKIDLSQIHTSDSSSLNTSMNKFVSESQLFTIGHNKSNEGNENDVRTNFRFQKKLTDLPSAQFPFLSENINAFNLSSDKPFVFGSHQNMEFNFSELKYPESLHKSVTDDDNVDEPSYNEEADLTCYQFVSPQLKQVVVQTGEEDESVLFCARSKLYRFFDGEWKEKGIGDVKILSHKQTHKKRILMRRDQVFKICLNHYLTSDINFQQKDEKSWMWAAVDFSSEISVPETFVLRFKSNDIASEFKKVVDICLDEKESPSTNKLLESTWNSDDMKNSLSEDIHILFVAEANAEQKKLATDLLLPINFYLYVNKPPCLGCRGCTISEDEEIISFNTSYDLTQPHEGNKTENKSSEKEPFLTSICNLVDNSSPFSALSYNNTRSIFGGSNASKCCI